MEDKYNLNRFIIKQNKIYDVALKELKRGRKESHWIWYIFPQIKGLGYSDNSMIYGISSIDEAKAYASNNILWNRYIECCTILLNLNTNNIAEVLDGDSIKLRSSLTLFYKATNNELLLDLINKYYDGKLDNLTLNILNNEK